MDRLQFCSRSSGLDLNSVRKSLLLDLGIVRDRFGAASIAVEMVIGDLERTSNRYTDWSARSTQILPRISFALLLFRFAFASLWLRFGFALLPFGFTLASLRFALASLWLRLASLRLGFGLALASLGFALTWLGLALT